MVITCCWGWGFCCSTSLEISVLTWTKEPCSTFVVVVGEALDPGDDRDDEVDEDTGDAKTGNEI